MRKKVKVENSVAMACSQKIISDIFTCMDDAKEIWAAIKTRFGGNANSKKMQKAVLKQQFEAFTISSKESLEKGYDKVQKLITIGKPLVLVVSDEDANHKLFEVPPSSAFDSLAMTMRTQKNIDTLQILFNQAQSKQSSGSYSLYNHSSSKATPLLLLIAMTASKIKKFIILTRKQAEGQELMEKCMWQFDTSRKSRGQDYKPVRTEKEALMTIDEGQINWVKATTDEELNHALMAFTVNNEVSMCSKLCLDSYNALQAKYDELQSEFGTQEAALVAHKLAVKKLESQLKASHKQQSSLNEKLNFQANQIFEKDEKLKKYRRIGMKAVKDKDVLQKIVDSWFASSKNLWKLVDCGMSSTVKIGLGYGIKSNAEVLGYEEEISRGIFAFRETNAGYNDIPLYSRFKQVEYKVKFGPQPQSPSPIESDASSTVSSTCQSNDSDGEQGTVSDNSANDDSIPIPSSEQVSISTQKTQPQVPKPQQTVDPSCAQHVKTPRQPIRTPVSPSPIPSYNRQNWNQRMERELGAGYSFERKPCFVCGSLSHLIKDCDYYEKKMARVAAFKSTRVVHANVRQVTPAWTNSNRQNVSSGSLHVSSGTHIKSGASSFNTGKQHVNSGRMYVNSGTQNKSGGSRVNTGKQNVNSVSSTEAYKLEGIFDSGCSGHMTGNRAHLEDYQELSKVGSVTFGGSKGSISGKGTIRLGNLVFDDVAFVKELGHFNLFSISQICDKKLNVLFTEKECFMVSSDFKMPNENQDTLVLLAKASSNEAKLWHRRLGKFDEKSDEGFLVGYSVNSKAFRVYNLVTKRVEVNLHVNFLEEKPNVQGIGHRWMFDLDYLTDSMNYIPVSVHNQANPADSKEVIDIDVQTEEDADLMVVSSTSLSEKIATKKTHFPRQPSSTPISKSADDIMTFRKELDALALKHLGPVPTTVPTSTNPVNTGSINLNTAFEEVNTGNTEAISPSADLAEEVFSDAGMME
ncbi:hypothetical protein Tco_0150711 [Tanacetum coccineum]